MKCYYVVMFKALVGENTYSSLSNFYFKTEEDARVYAQRFVAKSETFSAFEILDVIPFK